MLKDLRSSWMVWGGVRFGVFLPGPSMDLILPCAWNLNLRMAC
jgi:hypothetical protein